MIRSTRLRYDDVVVAGLVLISLVIALVATPLDPVDPDNYLLWLVAYGDGPLRRGLVGTILTATVLRGDSAALEDLFAATTAVSWLTYLSFLALVVRTWAQRRTLRHTLLEIGRPDGFVVDLLTMIVLVASPIGVLFYVSEAYYLDVANLLILSVFAHVVLSRPRRSIATVALVLCSALATLVHENALLTTVPAMAAIYWISSERGTRSRPALVRTLAAPVGCVVLVGVLALGSGDAGPPAVRAAAERLDVSQFGAAEATEIMERSVLDNVSYAFDKYRSLSGGGSRVIFTLLVAGPALWFLCVAITRRTPSSQRRWLLLAGLAPLGLTLLADDVYRWFSLSIVALGLVLLLVGSASSNEPGALGGAGVGESHDLDARPRDGRQDGNLVPFGILAIVPALVLPYPYFLTNDGNPMSEPVLRVLSNLKQLIL